ncbi:S41 family peptidase [Prevotella sp. Rep29]|uniref:S41 family peptidase n=1 Tax=Prevotella sp. Rep29 TaxID=2691580 RepID=UPI001C6ED1C4|nr:S41 family peptidase [Prevotella sp. Rep29]QYR11139.1 hypothetical protein GRF55_08590 [Prevotella sp. Rep29]
MKMWTMKLVKRKIFFRKGLVSKVLSVVCFLGFPALSVAQTSLTYQQVCADIDTMVSLIEQVHPDPYSRLSKKTFYKEVKKSKKQLQKGDISRLRAYMELSRLAALFKEGHFSVYSRNALFSAEEKGFPYLSLFHIEPQTHRLILKCDTVLGGISFLKGDELLKIDHLKAKKIVEKSLKYTFGERDFYRCTRAENDGTLQKWLYLNMPKNYYRIVMKTSSGTKTLMLKALNKKEIKEIQAKRPKEKDEAKEDKAWSYEMYNDSVMILHFNECVIEGFPEFLSEMFRQARTKNVRHLVIDNRYNDGGNSNASDEICRYLTDKPFIGCYRIVIRISEPVREFYRSYLKEYPQLSESIALPDTIMNEVMSLDDYQQPYADSLRFTGKVYLLNSHETFSSASWLAEVFKYYKLGIIVGEETGGMNISSGDIINTILPHTKMNLMLPYKMFYMIGAEDGSEIHGVLPDVPQPSEKAMDWVLKKICNK